MSNRYIYEPLNFNEIERFLVAYDNIKDIFVDRRKTIIFYDTCSFVNHSNSREKSLIADELLKSSELLVITRTVLMELAKKDGCLDQRQVDYFETLARAGHKILLLNEEFVGEVLSEALTLSNYKVNEILMYAFGEMSKSYVASIKRIKEVMEIEEPELFSDIFRGCSALVYADFFKFARSKKKSGDSLAEDLMFICFIILSAVPTAKCWLLSNDLNAFSTSISVRDYIQSQYLDEEDYGFLLHITTARLVFMISQIPGVRPEQLLNIISLNDESRGLEIVALKNHSMKSETIKTTPKDFVRDLLSEEFKLVLM